MSQAHKNRTSLSGAYKRSKDLAKEANMNKNKNPSGRDAYKAYPSTSGVFGQESNWKSGVKTNPDMRDSARLRGNKERGTDSSSKRVTVK
jgi:hypothetical protein